MPTSLILAGLPSGARFCDCPELRTSLTLNRAESLPQVQQSAVPGAAGPVPAAVALGNAWDALPVLIRMPSYVTSSRDARRAQAQPCQVDGTGDGAGALSAPAQGRGRPRERARRSSDGRHIKERGARLTGSGGRGRTRRSRGQRRRTRCEPEEAGPAEPAGDQSQPG
ncbi:Cysteine Protease Atg4A [Manis pentadactyla]|nr:Cysteine Protease Atg4A [Manis pentadactyla]